MLTKITFENNNRCHFVYNFSSFSTTHIHFNETLFRFSGRISFIPSFHKKRHFLLFKENLKFLLKTIDFVCFFSNLTFLIQRDSHNDMFHFITMAKIGNLPKIFCRILTCNRFKTLSCPSKGIRDGNANSFCSDIKTQDSFHKLSHFQITFSLGARTLRLCSARPLFWSAHFSYGMEVLPSKVPCEKIFTSLIKFYVFGLVYNFIWSYLLFFNRFGMSCFRDEKTSTQ